MKRLIASAAVVLALASPAFAQASPEAEALVRSYVAAFNKADAGQIASSIVKFNGASEADTKAKFAAEIAALRAEDFGKLDLYGVESCSLNAGLARVQMRYAYVYTFGGTMPSGDEAVDFDVSKTADGWRIISRTSKPFDAPLICDGFK